MENNIEKNVEQAEEIIASGETERSVVEKKPFPWWIIIVAAVAVIALVVVLVVAILPKEEEPVYTDYTVTVVDGIGTPVPNVMVKFIYPNGESKTRVTDKAGLASLKNVLAGDYQIKVEQGYSEAIILNSDYHIMICGKTYTSTPRATYGA